MIPTPFTAPLKDGARVLVREVTEDDRHLLQIGFAALSDRTRYFRFLMPHKYLTPAELDQFTATNGWDHVAIGALVDGTQTPEPVGIARYIRLADRPHAAEIAVTIADDYQHQGLGSLLVEVLATFARCDGITEFMALVHRENRSMLGLLAQFGGVQTSLGGTEIDVRFSVASIGDHTRPWRPTWQGAEDSAPRQRSTGIRPVAPLSGEPLSVSVVSSQPASVWENEGGAILPIVRPVILNE